MGHVLCFVLLLGLCLATGSVAAAPPDRGAYFEDASPSVAGAELAAARRDITRQMAELAKRSPVSRWEIFRFADRSFTLPPLASIEFPVFLSPDCEPQKASEARRLLRQLDARQDKADQARCASERETYERRWQANATNSVEKVLGFLASQTPQGRCSAIADVVERVSLDGDKHLRLVVIASDGEETCPPAHRSPIAAPAVPRTVILALVASKLDASAERFRKQVSRWRTLAPWVQVIPSFGIRETLAAVR